MTTVRHDEVKQGMTIKDARGIWTYIHRVIKVGEPTYVSASNVNGQLAGKKFQLALYEQTSGYEVHPNSALIRAKAHQRAGRADVGNMVLQEYSIKLADVNRVDNEGEICGYCTTNEITTNVYATVTTENGRTEESAWSTCTACTVDSIVRVENVDPAYTVTIERSAR
jgi:hypothetical protein